jgi:hypothetical protein
LFFANKKKIKIHKKALIEFALSPVKNIDVNIIKQIPANEEFWNFFNKEIYTMNQAQKLEYMDS